MFVLDLLDGFLGEIRNILGRFDAQSEALGFSPTVQALLNFLFMSLFAGQVEIGA